MFSGIDMQLFSSAQQDDGLFFYQALYNHPALNTMLWYLPYTSIHWLLLNPKIFPWKIHYRFNNYWLKSLLITFILCQ